MTGGCASTATVYSVPMDRAITLLIVDDVRAFLDLERTFLRRAVCKILTASTGLEAIKIAHAHRPDLILLDVEMPEMNGIEAARVLKTTPGLSAIPVVMVSGTQRKDEALAAGAREFVAKPLDEERFLDLVRRHVPIRERMDARREVRARCRITADGVGGEGVAADVSVSGLRLETDLNLSLGDRVTVRFPLPYRPPHEEIRADAFVVRLAPGGFGLGFAGLSEADRWRLQEFIAETAD